MSVTILTCWLAAALAAGDAPAPPAAPPAPALPLAEQPYRAVLCLRFSDDPTLTPLFVDSVRRQVRDQLANYLGQLAQVEVLTEGHWLLDEFPHAPIDEPPLTPQLLAERGVFEKIFLVGIDHVDAEYLVTCRHADGRTQQIGPVRTRTTADRYWVGKAICLAVKDDFLPVAVLAPGPEKFTVPLQFQGAKWTPRLVDLLNKDCILQPFRVVKRGDGSVVREPIPFTVLRLHAADGVARAAVITSETDPWQRSPRITGFEAIKLATQRGAVRLRLVDAATDLPVQKCIVSANDRGPDEFENRDIVGSPNSDGVIVTRPLEHIAFVRVSQGGDAATQIPIPITEGVCEITLKVRVDQAAGQRSDFDRDLRFLYQDVQTLDALQSETVRKYNELDAARRYEEAVKVVEKTIADVGAMRPTAQQTLRDLTARAQPLGQAENPLLKRAADRLQEVQNRETTQGRLVQTLNDLITLRDAQSRADVLIEQGRQAETDADVEEALARYELALVEQPEQPELRARVDALKAAWEIRNPAHRQARELVFDRWAKAEVTELEALLPEIAAALQTLNAMQDFLTMRRLIKANDDHLGALTAVVEQAQARGAEADLAEAQQYANLLQRVAAFNVQAGMEMVAATPEGAMEDAAPAIPVPAAAPPVAAPPEGAPKAPLELPPEEEEAPVAGP